MNSVTGSGPDPLVLRSLLDRLSTERADLDRLASYGPEALLADVDRLKSAKYSLVVAIEVCIDICQHVIARRGLRAPDSFADAFRVLGEAGLLPAGQVEVLADMAAFRNLLVHGYARVDDRRVVGILVSKLDDFAAFSRVAAGFPAEGV